jgi:cell division protein FtsL
MSETILRALPKINGFSLRRPKLLPIFVTIAVLLVVALFYVWSRVEVTAMEYEISQLESTLRKERQETSNLRLEAASLSSPERIEKVARRELGLHLPLPEQVVTVE